MSALCCRYIRISPAGRLFFDMGAPCNDCLLEKAFGNITFGSLNSMALDGTDIQPYAQGRADLHLFNSAPVSLCSSMATMLAGKGLASTTYLRYKRTRNGILQHWACLFYYVQTAWHASVSRCSNVILVMSAHSVPKSFVAC